MITVLDVSGSKKRVAEARLSVVWTGDSGSGRMASKEFAGAAALATGGVEKLRGERAVLEHHAGTFAWPSSGWPIRITCPNTGSGTIPRWTNWLSISAAVAVAYANSKTSLG